MKTLRLVGIVALLAAAAHAQFIGYVSDQSTNQVAFAAQAANGSSVTFNNIGQSAHSLSYCLSGFIGTVSLLGSNDGTFVLNTTAIPLSQANYNVATTTCRVLPAGGYFPALKAQVSNYGAGTITAWYNGIASPVAVVPAAVSSTGPTTPVQCDQTAGSSLTGANSFLIATGTSNQKLWICSITFYMTTAPAGAQQFSIQSGTGATCSGSPVIEWFLPVLPLTPLTPFFFGGSFGAFLTTQPGPNVCATLNGGAGVVAFTISFAQGFTNP